jgi:hypothetical protein
MKTKEITVTVGEKIGLKKFSSASIEVSETVVLEEGDNRKEAIATTHKRLKAWVDKRVEERLAEDT